MGFDTSRLFYAIVVAEPKTKGNRELRQAVVHTILKNKPQEATHGIDYAKIYFNKFNRTSADKNLAWAFEFWSKNREAEPAGNQNKCIKCEYKIPCQEAAAQTPSSNSSIR